MKKSTSGPVTVAAKRRVAVEKATAKVSVLLKRRRALKLAVLTRALNQDLNTR